jgi:hypothetical protein
MLPGFRFLFAAIVLSLSILVFGLGAAALLRAAHEEFASNPSWHAAPETKFAQQSEAARPTLTMLRVDPPATEQKASDNVPSAGAPAEQAPITSMPAESERIAALQQEDSSLPETANTMLRLDPPAAEQKASDNVPSAGAPAEQAPITSMPAESERIAALKQEDSSLLESVKPEIPVSENPAQSEAVPAQADAPAPADQTKTAASEQVSSPAQVLPPANEAAPTTSEQPSAPASPDADLASTKIATLGGPPVTIEAQPPAKTASAMPDRSVIKKRRLQARRAAERRRIALRARLAPQQPPNPFAQPAATVRSR